jgi:acyl-lipid omega-6 desaturase (Delta-12 desaturase)
MRGLLTNHGQVELYPKLGVIGRLTLGQSFSCVRLVLWDEDQQRLVSFHEVRQRYALV